MIIPSKQVLLISVPEKKEVFMFDPKTACVLQTYSTESELAPTVAYFQIGQQFLIPHLNNTYVNVWDTDARQPRKFSVGEGEKITCLKMTEGNILLLGSSHGQLYVYQLPSGILIRKVQLHSQSSEIKTIIFLQQMGYLISGTKKQLKHWPLRDIIGDQKPVAQKTIHSVIQIIAVELIRQILCVVTEKTVNFYYACNFSIFTLNKDFQQLQNATCACSSAGSLFIGDALGKVRQIVINPHEKQLIFEHRKGTVLLQNKKPIQIETKQPISSLCYVSSLQYLVAGNYKGEVKIWHQGNLKNSVQLAKSSISLVFAIPRPSKENKIPQGHKIKSLHKQELTKVDQPIIFNSGEVNYIEQNTEIELGENVYLERMLSLLNDREELLQTEIEVVRRQNKQLLEANLHYFTMLDQAGEAKTGNTISQ